MSYLLRLLALVFVSIAMPAHAVTTIDKINISTVFGYAETYSPGSFNRFGILGVPFSYELSNGETRVPGAGWIPYTNGTLTSETMSPSGVISYEFGSVNNWAQGEGVLFYHLGQVWNYSTNDLWSEAALTPASALVLSAQIGSSFATMTGLARVAFNNPSSAWGSPENFVPYSVAEGTLVPFSATYTLLNGATWQPGIFDSSFQYEMTGEILMVPEPATWMVMLLGLTIVGMGYKRQTVMNGSARLRCIAA